MRHYFMRDRGNAHRFGYCPSRRALSKKRSEYFAGSPLSRGMGDARKINAVSFERRRGGRSLNVPSKGAESGRVFRKSSHKGIIMGRPVLIGSPEKESAAVVATKQTQHFCFVKLWFGQSCIEAFRTRAIYGFGY